jgi:hypothetical protein
VWTWIQHVIHKREKLLHLMLYTVTIKRVQWLNVFQILYNMYLFIWISLGPGSNPRIIDVWFVINKGAMEEIFSEYCASPLSVLLNIYSASGEITNKMQPCNRIYYSTVHWRLNMFRAAHRSWSGALTVFAAPGLHTHVVAGHHMRV